MEAQIFKKIFLGWVVGLRIAAGGPQLTAGSEQLPHLTQRNDRAKANLAFDLCAAAASVLRAKMGRGPPLLPVSASQNRNFREGDRSDVRSEAECSSGSLRW